MRLVQVHRSFDAVLISSIFLFEIVIFLFPSVGYGQSLGQLLRANGVAFGLMACPKPLISEERRKTEDLVFGQKWRIGGGSNLPTIKPNDLVTAIRTKKILRGDILVFKLSSDNKPDDHLDRLIGLPGERVQLRGGRLYVNGVLVERRRIDPYVKSTGNGQSQHVTQFVEVLPGGSSHTVLEMSGDSGPMDETGVYTVPKDHYFVMGDNRDNSLDSRVRKIGFVPRANIIGVVSCAISSDPD